MSTNITPGEQQSWVDTPPISPPLRHYIADITESQTWIDALATPFQNWLHSLFGSQGEPSYKVKDAIDGTWAGHPLHPVMVTIPLGAWTCTAVLDLFSLGRENAALERGADATLWIGLLGAMTAIPTGVTQWADIDGPDRRVGLLHGLLNGSITLLNLTSGILRLMGKRKPAVALSTTAYLTSLFTAYLGGDLSYAKGIGVNHVAFEGGSDDFVPVMNAQDLADGKLTRVDVAGIPAVLLRQGRAIYAIAATCSHLGGPLDEGTVRDGVVQCPWHGSCFRMTDGSIVNGPATYAQPTFAVRVRNGNIELRRLEHA